MINVSDILSGEDLMGLIYDEINRVKKEAKDAKQRIRDKDKNIVYVHNDTGDKLLDWVDEACVRGSGLEREFNATLADKMYEMIKVPKQFKEIRGGIVKNMYLQPLDDCGEMDIYTKCGAIHTAPMMEICASSVGTIKIYEPDDLKLMHLRSSCKCTVLVPNNVIVYSMAVNYARAGKARERLDSALLDVLSKTMKLIDGRITYVEPLYNESAIRVCLESLFMHSDIKLDAKKIKELGLVDAFKEFYDFGITVCGITIKRY